MIEKAHDARLHDDEEFKYLNPTGATLSFCDLTTYQKLKLKRTYKFDLVEKAILNPNIKVRFFGNHLAEINSDDYNIHREYSTIAVSNNRLN